MKKVNIILGKSLTFLFWFVVICIVLWNSDFFWQTNIKPLKSAQSTYFPEKYKNERIKSHLINVNEDFLNNINNEMLDSRKEVYNLKNKLSLEKDKCRYYTTSLMIIKQLKRKYTEDDFQNVVRCTNKECVDIINESNISKNICD